MQAASWAQRCRGRRAARVRSQRRRGTPEVGWGGAAGRDGWGGGFDVGWVLDVGRVLDVGVLDVYLHRGEQ